MWGKNSFTVSPLHLCAVAPPDDSVLSPSQEVELEVGYDTFEN